MPLGSLVPIVVVEGLCLVAVATGISSIRRSNANNALPAPSVGLTITLAVAVLLLIAVIVRTVSLRVVLRHDDLEIRNLWRTHRLAWSDITDVAPPKYGHIRRAGLCVSTRTGKVVSASALIQGRLDPSGRGAHATAAIAQRIEAAAAEVNLPPE